MTKEINGELSIQLVEGSSGCTGCYFYTLGFVKACVDATDGKCLKHMNLIFQFKKKLK